MCVLCYTAPALCPKCNNIERQKQATGAIQQHTNTHNHIKYKCFNLSWAQMFCISTSTILVHDTYVFHMKMAVCSPIRCLSLSLSITLSINVFVVAVWKWFFSGGNWKHTLNWCVCCALFEIHFSTVRMQLLPLNFILYFFFVEFFIYVIYMMQNITAVYTNFQIEVKWITIWIVLNTKKQLLSLCFKSAATTTTK